MKWFYNLKISAKLIVGFMVVAVIAAVLGIVGIVQLKSNSNDYAELYIDYGVSQGLLGQAAMINQANRVTFLNIFMNMKSVEKQKYAAQIDTDSKLVDKYLTSYEKTISSPQERELYNQVKTAREKYGAVRSKIINFMLSSEDEIQAKHMIDNELAPLGKDTISKFNQLIELNTQLGQQGSEELAKKTHTTVIILILIVIIAVLMAVGLGYWIARVISRPINKLVGMADHIADGKLDHELNIHQRDEIGMLAGSFQRVIANVKTMAADANMLANAAIEGKFSTRADVSKHHGEYRKIVEGVNATLDTVVEKSEWYEAIIDAVPFPIHVTDNNMNWTLLNKAFETLMVEQGTLRDRVSGYGKPCSTAGANICNTQNCGIKQLLKGKPESYFDWCGLSCKQDTAYLTNQKGERIGFVEVVTDLTPLLRANEYREYAVGKLETNLQRIAQGNLEIDFQLKEADEHSIAVKGQFEQINQELLQVKQAIDGLVQDASMLSAAAVEGKLSTRADASKHQGEFREVVEGVNQTLDAVITPLNVAADYVDKISRGALPEKITDSYNGDFNVIKNNLNNCIDNINMLVADANMLVNAAVEGKLATRADAGKHHGDYRKIVEGVNQTLDAVIAPINEVAAVMQEVSKGNLHMLVTGTYQGDLAELKNAVNQTVAALGRVVGEISENLTKIAQGNINLDKVRPYLGEFRSVSDALNIIIDELNEVLGEIRNAAEQVASGSRQVSDGSQALSQGATEQASSIEELTASITEIASQTKQNATNASQANELAISAKDNAQQGNERMKQMLSSMVEINDSSANISKIIKVIDEIAFQTNILALNAAVEAARAGQHGKGFAVVAEEVRNLAGRSANAAKETTALIEGSIKKVEIGTKIANDTAEALVMIVEGVEKAADLVGEIASASNEQATGIAQINKGIEQVSQVVQTNSATAQQSAAASEELSGQSELLKDMIGRFTLKRMAKSNYERFDNSDTDTVKRKNSGGADVRVAKTEAAATNSKPRIALSDQEFGKYSS